MLYAGDVDYICNWLGNKKWALDLEWDGKTEFVQAEDKPWMLSNGENMGRIRSHENFKFLQVYNAGHMVPMDQPQAASEMLNSWLDGSLGNCFVHRIQNPIPKLQILEININKIALIFFSGVEAEDDYDFVLGQEDHPNIVVIH